MESLVGWISQIQGAWWFVVGAAVVVFINGLATLVESIRKLWQVVKDVRTYLTGTKMTDKRLRTELASVSRELMNFVAERQRGEPKISFDNFQESADASSTYGQETNHLYARDFGGKVSALRDELLRRGVRDQELDMYYKHPTNPIGYRALAVRLDALSRGPFKRSPQEPNT